MRSSTRLPPRLRAPTKARRLPYQQPATGFIRAAELLDAVGKPVPATQVEVADRDVGARRVAAQCRAKRREQALIDIIEDIWHAVSDRTAGSWHPQRGTAVEQPPEGFWLRIV